MKTTFRHLIENKNKFALLLTLLLFFCPRLQAEDGSQLWLRGVQQSSGKTKVTYKGKKSPTINLVIEELQNSGLQNVELKLITPASASVKAESYTITPVTDGEVCIESPGETGLLYGAYHLLRLNACQEPLKETITENPTYEHRILNHWDNLDGTVERGYAGHSLWKWEELPTVSPRYAEYARANASIGINGTVLNNVNASPQMLSTEYLKKVKVLADIFRPYGLKVYLSVNFASPIGLDNLPTADPLDAKVIEWWDKKAKEIYSLIPDFGGFLVKANSEGQPGPCDYNRTHAEGANMLADALKPYGGIIMWRAFVYAANDKDRAKQAYQEFKPLDGKFRDNVIVQVKNGPVDFQPREPYSPLFGSMKKTPLMLEFQITQEYLGFSNHLAYLAPMWKECLFSETFQNGSGSTVLESTLSSSAIAGVTNIGDNTNWCGHDFAQANWYAFGRLAWNPSLTSREIAHEWLRQTFTNDPLFVDAMSLMMIESREAVVNYMMPLGLHHIFAEGHHYGPEPWFYKEGMREDWMPSYYHKADAQGIGFDRSKKATAGTQQYNAPLCEFFNNLNTCPDEYLLWFHHLPWDYEMKSGYTLWESLCRKYQEGVNQTAYFIETWNSMKPYVDADRFKAVSEKLEIQANDAVWWKDACLLYFQDVNKLPFPAGISNPVYKLDDLKNVRLKYGLFGCPDKETMYKEVYNKRITQ